MYSVSISVREGIPLGKAITATPTKDEKIVINLPAVVSGEISPYPTVVREIAAKYNASKKSTIFSLSF